MTTIFLCGDVMTGRGIDQILPHPGDPALRESVVTDARTYVTLAERVNGEIARPVPFAWPWGDALSVLDDLAPDVRLINLETAVTAADDFAPGKAVHYRMNPANAGCLTAVRPDVCVLANNHVLDFGPGGLAETLRTLSGFGIQYVGAGRDVQEAHRAAVSDVAGWSCAYCGRRAEIQWCSTPLGCHARTDRASPTSATSPITAQSSSLIA